jgi:hypothetical protein
MNGNLIFNTIDKQQFEAPKEIIQMLKNIQDRQDRKGIINLEITSNVVNVAINSNDFKLILMYCERHQYTNPPEIIRPLQYNDLTKCVADPWDADFINSLEFDRVTELLQAASSLEVMSLIDLCYARLAMYFRGSNFVNIVTPINQLKNDFMLTDSEFTEHDLVEIKQGNNWLMVLTEDRLKELEHD